MLVRSTVFFAKGLVFTVEQFCHILSNHFSPLILTFRISGKFLNSAESKVSASNIHILKFSLKIGNKHVIENNQKKNTRITKSELTASVLP